MNLELYFAPGACSFVPHVTLEAIRAATGQAFEPKLVKLHKGEHRTAQYSLIVFFLFLMRHENNMLTGFLDRPDKLSHPILCFTPFFKIHIASV